MNGPCSGLVRGSFIHEKPAGTSGVGDQLEAARVEQLEQPGEIEALLVLDALAELEQRVLGEVAGEAVEPVVERRRARHREVERARPGRVTRASSSQQASSSVTCSST